MIKLGLGSLDPAQYGPMTADEKQAWHNPERHSYHSYHVERMAEDWYRWRDSRTAHFYVGTHADLCQHLLAMQQRRVDPSYAEHVKSMRVLTQEEINDLFSDL